MIRRFASAGAEAVRAQVVELLGVDLGDRRGVGAADVVGLDLEPGDRVGVGRLREQQVPALLEGVGLLGARVDADHPAPDRGRRRPSRTPRKARSEVGVGGGVLLGGVEVEVLGAVAGVGAGDPGARALAGEAGLHPDLAARGAEAEGDPVEGGVALDLGALGGEDPAPLAQALGADVAEVGARADPDLGDRVEERRRARGSVASHCSQTSASAPSSSTIRVRKPSAAPVGVVDRRDLGGLLEALARGDVDEGSAAPGGVVAGDEGVVRGRRASRGAPATRSG